MKTREKVHQHHDGRRGVRPPHGLLLSLLAQVPVLLWFWPPSPTTSLVVIGLAMVIAGVVLNVWSVRLFRASEVGVCPFSDVPKMVTGGPYRMTRNPMYLGLVLIAAGVALTAGLLWNLVAPAVFALWLHFRFILPEEDFLQEGRGEAYLRYASRTPRWLGLPARTAGMVPAREWERTS